MGTVFEAIDEFRLDLPNSGQRIALKALHSAVTQREDLLSELQTEFQHLQSLSHPNIVRVHEFDRDAGVAFFTMELLTGALLSRVLSARGDTALPRPDALAIIRDIGAALAHAHSRGLVHGDVNPQNIFITNEGDLRILDFGASHQLPQALADPQTAASQRVPVATRGYASCELLEGQRPDARDDVFAFACVAYLLLSGRHPFPDRTALEARIRRVRARRPRGLTRRQWGVLQEGLRWDRSRRPSAIQEWLNRFGLQDAAPHLPALRELVKVPPPKSRLGLSTALAVVVVAVLAVGGFWLASNYESLLHSVSEWRTPAPQVPQAAAPELPSNPAPALQPSTASSVPGAAPPSSTLAHPRSPSQQISASQQTSPSRPLSPSQPASLAPAPAVPPPASSQSASASQVKPKYPVAAPQPPDASARPATPVSSRIELASDSVDVAATDKIAHVTVRRKGSSRGVASFTWWTESGTAKPGLDFVPVTSHVETIGDGQSAVSLDVSLSDAPRSRAKSFYVVIDHAESGPALGARTLTMVTMQPTESAP